jgi:hypothetical protein
MVDDLPDRRLIIVRAETQELASEALRRWIEMNPRLRLSSTARISPEPSFCLADGTLITHGTRLEQHYELP